MKPIPSNVQGRKARFRSLKTGAFRVWTFDFALWTLLAASLASAQTNDPANLTPLKLDENPPAPKNRFGLSYRMGFNITARFKNIGGFTPTRNTTPSGDPWNYDNGYNLDDAPGTPPGMTWYWGYSGQPSQSAQAPGDGFLYLSRSTSPADVVSSGNSDDPQHGF